METYTKRHVTNFSSASEIPTVCFIDDDPHEETKLVPYFMYDLPNWVSLAISFECAQLDWALLLVILWNRL